MDAPVRGYCRRCRYELTGITPESDDTDPVCPECGAVFRHGDPRTTMPVPHGPMRRWAGSSVGRVTIATALGLIGIVTNVLPRPVPTVMSGINWAHWEWFGASFGTQRLPAGYARGNAVMRVDWEVSWRWGQVRAVRVVDSKSGSVLWRVRRVGDGRFLLEVNDPSVDWRDILTGFNAVRRPDELFGVTINNAQGTRPASGFRAEGAKEDVLGALLREYGLAIETFIVPGNDGKVWVYDEAARVMRFVTPEEAIAMGYNPQRDDHAELPRPFGG